MWAISWVIEEPIRSGAGPESASWVPCKRDVGGDQRENVRDDPGLRKSGPGSSIVVAPLRARLLRARLLGGALRRAVRLGHEGLGRLRAPGERAERFGVLQGPER